VTGLVARVGHLGRRFAGSLSRRPPTPDDERWAVGFLLPGERALWDRMGAVDRRHSIDVARRFVARRPAATRAEVAGALLHDCGKAESGLGTLARVVATVVGPRTARLRAYHDHEAIGADLATAAGADPTTVALIEDHGPAAADLRAADDV
jgi:hypothetical protein